MFLFQTDSACIQTICDDLPKKTSFLINFLTDSIVLKGLSSVPLRQEALGWNSVTRSLPFVLTDLSTALSQT